MIPSRIESDGIQHFQVMEFAVHAENKQQVISRRYDIQFVGVWVKWQCGRSR